MSAADHEPFREGDYLAEWCEVSGTWRWVVTDAYGHRCISVDTRAQAQAWMTGRSDAGFIPARLPPPP